MNDNNYTVYKHMSPSGKYYIGITKQKPQTRWRRDGSGYIHNEYFYNAIKKYGWDNFQHDILFTKLTKEEAEQKEIELIAYYKSNQRDYGYNISNGGNCFGSHSEESKRKIAYANQNRSAETREKLRKARLGKKNSTETRKRISESNTGREVSEETKDKIRKAITGIKRSEETKQKISTAKSGIQLSEEHKRKISESEKGRIVTDETRKKISKAHTGKRLSDKIKLKISNSLMGHKGKPLTKEHKELLLYYVTHLPKETRERMANARKVPIIQLSKDGDFIKRFDSATDVKNELGINNSNIVACMNGRQKTAGGYVWMYESDYLKKNKNIS